MTGTAAEAAKMAGIPYTTALDWMSQESWPSFVDAARKQCQSELDAKFTRIIHSATKEVIDRLENGEEAISRNGEVVRRKVSAKDSALIASVFADKRSILRGEPTNISRRQDAKKTLEEQKQDLEKAGAAEAALENPKQLQ
jgi:hypothetical protein